MPQLIYGATQYVTLPIPTHTVDGASVDPSSDPAWMAFLPVRGAAAAEDDWQEAEWVTDESTSPTSYAVRLLVASTTLVAGGVYDILGKIQDTPELVIVKSSEPLYVAAAI